MMRVYKLLLLFFMPVLLMAKPEQEMQKVTLMLDWFVNPNHGPIIVAKEKGYFKQFGIDLVIQEPSDPNLAPKLAAVGDVDLAVYYQNSLIYAIDSEVPIVWAGTLISSPLEGLIVLSNNGITSLADMKGKTIGVTSNIDHKAFVNALFQPFGFGYKDINFVNVGWNLTSSLLARRVDGILGGYRNFEMNEIKLLNKKAKMFYYEEHSIPMYDELIFVTQKHTKNKLKIRKFLEGVEKGVVFIINHPKEGWELFKKYNIKKLDNELNRLAWKDTLVYFSHRPLAKDVNRYQRMLDFLYNNKEIKKNYNAKDVMLDLD